MADIDAFALKTWEERGGEYIRRLMRDLGLTMEQAAGIVGNLGSESIGFTALQEITPKVPGSRGGGGIAQWTGPRRKSFEAWCALHNLSPKSDAGNYGFLIEELRGSYRKLVAQLQLHLSVDDAVWLVGQTYERPGGTTSANLPGYADRLKWAKRALDGAKRIDTGVPVQLDSSVSIQPPAVDRDLLADVVRAAQRLVGVEPDGVLGPLTIAAVQKAQRAPP